MTDILSEASPMKSLQSRLQSAMAAANVGQAELARALGIKQPSVHALLSGTAERTKYILDIGRVLGVDPNWLQDGCKHAADAACQATSRDADIIRVPHYKEPGAQNGEERVVLDARFIPEKAHSAREHLAAVTVIGDAMSPTLDAGDVVLADLSQTSIASDGLYAVALRDAIVIKRLSHAVTSGKVRVMSDNALYPTTQARLDDVSVFGRVVHIASKCL